MILNYFANSQIRDWMLGKKNPIKMLVEREMTRLPSSCNNTLIITLIAGQFWTKPRMEISSRRSKSSPSIRKQGWKSFQIMFPHIFKNTLAQVQGDPEKVWPGENLPILWFRQSRGGERPIFDHHCRLDCQVDFLKERFKEKKFFNNEEHKSLLKKVTCHCHHHVIHSFGCMAIIFLIDMTMVAMVAGATKVQKDKEGAQGSRVMRLRSHLKMLKQQQQRQHKIPIVLL